MGVMEIRLNSLPVVIDGNKYLMESVGRNILYGAAYHRVSLFIPLVVFYYFYHMKLLPNLRQCSSMVCDQDYNSVCILMETVQIFGWMFCHPQPMRTLFCKCR